MEHNNSIQTPKGSEAGMESYIVDGFVDFKGNPATKLKHGGTRAAMFIFVMTALENMANLGTSMNLMTYFYYHMHYDLSESAGMVTNFMATTFLLTIVGAFVTDAYLSKLHALLAFGFVEFLGFMLLTVQAQVKSLQLPHCDMFETNSVCERVSGRKSLILYSGLYLVALGSGGLKATLPTLGADQFDENDPKEKHLVSSFFNFFLVSLCVGGCFGIVFLVWLQNNQGWDISLSISSSSMLFGLFIIATGYTKFRNRIPTGSPATKILNVIVTAFRNRNLDLPSNVEDLYEEKQTYKFEDTERLPHTEQFTFLDRAAIMSSVTKGRKLCTVTNIEEVKILIRMVPIFASTILLNTCLAQLQTFSIQQGATMNKKLGNLEIASASVPIIPMFFIIILTPLYDRVFVPLARRFTGYENGITYLRRVGAGLFLSILSMVAAAIVEIKRKEVAREHNLVHANPILNPLPMSVLILGIQYFIFGIADLFTFVGLLEFFYRESPKGFRSMGTAFAWCSMSMGYFLSSVLVHLINSVTENSKTGGWLKGSNINLNHLDLFYWALALLSLMNFFNYLYWANWYTYKEVDSGNKSVSKC